MGWAEDKALDVCARDGTATEAELIARAIREAIERCTSDEMVAAVREAVILEKLRYENGGIWAGPIPEHGAAKVYVSEVDGLVRAGLAAIRKLREP